MSNRLANRIITPDGTVMQSYHRHHCEIYTDANGLDYMVDGGLEYQRTIVHDMAPHVDASVYDTDPHDVIREAFHWGNRGKLGDQPLKWVALSKMSDAHIQAIIETQTHIQPHIREAFENELTYRELLNINVKDKE